MKVLATLIVLLALVAQYASALPSREDLAQKARRDAEDSIIRMEMQYHKELHTEQEKLVLSMQRAHSKKPLKRVETNPNDVAALKALYNSTNGAKWNNNTGWLKGDPCHYPFWYGLYCAYGRVLQINLVYNGLSGPLPAELAKADAVQVMRFYSNLISGKIPKEILSMPSLQIFDVNTNIVSGTLPSEITSKSLQHLVFYSNQMEGEFPSSFNTPQLQSLEGSSNQFTGSLPESLSGSKNLSQLVVSRNLLTGSLPESYGNLANLQKLWIFNNNFEKPSIPNSWQGMTGLLEIQADGIFGELPSWLGDKWSKLQRAVIVNGLLTGNFPDSLCNCRDMVELRLFNNSLSGDLPDCMCQLRSLTDIELSDNGFTGPLPECIGDIRGLENVAFARNKMSGTFPSSLGYLQNLTALDLSGNMFYGSIPNTIDNLQLIAEFAVCYNKFSAIESGVDNFFNRIKNYGCLFYSNPWSCPLEVTVPKECQARCSDCNSGEKHSSCSSCVKDNYCGWCSQGGNCLEGNEQGPDSIYQCPKNDWTSGDSGTCQ